jgi:lipoprotein-releasing system permease protein
MLFLSWRQLMARKKQTFLILLGISFGTLLYVSISGVQLGMRGYMYEQLLNNTAHVLISGSENKIEEGEITSRFYGANGRVVRWVRPPSGRREEVRLQNYQGWYERLLADPDVIDFSPRLSTNVLMTSGKFSASVRLFGVIPERQVRISSIEHYVTQGSWSALNTGSNQIVIGSGVADILGVQVGDIVNLSAGLTAGSSKPFKVVGITHFGNKQVDESMSFAHLTNVQTLTRSPGRVTEIAVALTDIDGAMETADTWQTISSDKVEDWQEANKMFMEMFRVQDFTRYFITTSVLIVAAFGIYNVLTIMINQKRREIAILRAIGYAPRRIVELILYQGILLGFSGGILGLVLGFLMCLWIGSIDFGFEIGGQNHLWVSYDPSIYLTAFVTANIAAWIASYLPAWAASRMTPMDIMRSE